MCQQKFCVSRNSYASSGQVSHFSRRTFAQHHSLAKVDVAIQFLSTAAVLASITVQRKDSSILRLWV